MLDPGSHESVVAYLRAGEELAGGVGGAKRCSTVFSCVRLLSDATASLPLKLIKEDGSGNKMPGVSDPLYWVLAVQPNTCIDKFSYWKFNINCLLLRGFFVSRILRSGNGKIVGLNPINPSYVDSDGIELRSDGELIFPITVNGIRELVPAKELFFAYYETLDGIRPCSPIKFAESTIRLARGAEKYGIDTLEKGAVLPGYYTTDEKINEVAFEQLKKQLEQNGINSGRAPLLDRGVKYNTVSLTAEDMQMLETRRYQKEEICGIFGVPPHLIGDVAQAKGWSTMEQTMTEFLQLSLNPILVRIENAITTRLIPVESWGKSYAKFNVEGLLRGDMTARTNYYRAMFQNGALSSNEIRAKEDFNAIDGGDTYYIPANMVNAKKQEVGNGLA